MDVQRGTKPAPVVEESTLLERVARLISSVRGAKPDYAHLAAELEPALPFDLFGIVLLRHDREAVRVAVCQREGEDANWVARYHQHPLVDSMVERIEHSLDQDKSAGPGASGHEGSGEIVGHERSAEALFVENFPAGVNGLPAECGDALCGHPQLRAILVVPLIAGGNLLGTLELGSTRLDAYSDPALQRLIHAIARVLATAIEGAQVGGNVEIQDRQRAELKDVSTVLTTAVDLQMILDRIVTGITNALHVASAIVRFDRTQRCLLLDAQSKSDPLLLQKVLRQENAYNRETIIGSTFARRDSQVSQDIGEDQRFPLSSHFASELGVRSLFCYPLLTGQHVYGALLLLSPEPGGFTPLKTDIFALFAGQATVAIHNGMLLQAAQERQRFQELIEQFAEVSRENVFTEQDQIGEQELLQRLRDETVKTFGVSLGSVLHFISDHLLTRGESQLQDILRSASTFSLLKEKEGSDELLVQESGGIYSDEAELLARASEGALTSTVDHEETAFLMRVADDALARSDFLNDISAALMRTLHVDDAHPQAYEQLKRELVEPWFIIGLSGACLYLNHAAEQFCGRRADRENTHAWRPWPQEDQALFSSFHPLSWSQEPAQTLEEALAALLPRMRNLEEVQSYLREFTVAAANDDGSIEQNDAPLPIFLVCTMAVEALAGQKALKNGHDLAEASSARGTAQAPAFSGRAPSPTLLMDMSPSDHHYQFVRHALYNEHGQWFANALHVRDVTEQVRDEKNKSVLLASVSHDLRTPLTAIKGAVTGLLDTDVVWDEQSRREMLEEINTEADHLHSLVTSLVEMSRIEMGALTLDKEWCDLGELVHNTFNRIQRALGDFEVEFEIQPDLPLVHVDYAQLGRVFTNLLENAARHSPERSRIRVCLDVLHASDLPTDLPRNITRAVRVQVVDQGQGVPEAERERIFKTFYSLDVKGNGLGLAICRGIVEAHQGRIWVEGMAGQGAHFIFILPIVSA
jgi:signal transduction histidine kinase/GAF domain-containing protein